MNSAITFCEMVPHYYYTNPKYSVPLGKDHIVFPGTCEDEIVCKGSTIGTTIVRAVLFDGHYYFSSWDKTVRKVAKSPNKADVPHNIDCEWTLLNLDEIIQKEYEKRINAAAVFLKSIML